MPFEVPGAFGKYELLDPIGAGGMAEVFLARAHGPHGFERKLVIKRILPHLSRDAKFVEMFVAEAKVCSLLSHGNIVQLYEFGEIGGQLYLAMEHVRGTDLRRLLGHLHERKSSFRPEVAAYVARQVLRALAHAHQHRSPEGTPLGIVHRDVSPSNILVSDAGEVKLCDFGVARARAVRRVTESGSLRGKLGYLSPEQVEGQPVDASSDLFAVGIVLWEMLAGDRLFHADSELEVLAKVRAGVVPDPPIGRDPAAAPLLGIVRKALQRDRRDRYADAAAFERDLEQVFAQAAGRDPAASVAELVRQLAPGPPAPSEIYDGFSATVPEVEPDLDAVPTTISASTVRPERPAGLRPIAWAAPLAALAAAGLVLWASGTLGGSSAPAAPVVSGHDLAPLAPPRPIDRPPAPPREPPGPRSLAPASLPVPADAVRPAVGAPATRRAPRIERRPRRPRADPADSRTDTPAPSKERLVDPFSIGAP